MVMAVVPKEEAGGVVSELVAAGHTATFMEARGGALRQAYSTLFTAVRADELDVVLDVISRYCHSCVSLARGGPPTFSETESSETAEVGGAVVFVWDLERFERY